MGSKDQENPFQPPEQSADVEATSTRWRIVGVVLLYFFGGVTILGGLVSIGMLTTIPPEYRDLILMKVIAGGLMMTTGGALLIFSGHLCWKRRWAWMVLAIICGFALSSFGGNLLENLSPR